VEIVIEAAPGEPFALHLRVPGWANNASLSAGNEVLDDPALPGNYAAVSKRTWETGDSVRLVLPMEVQRLECHPYVANNNGRVALRRGPLVYCIEQADLGGVDPREVALPAGSKLEAVWEPGTLGGVVTLTGPGLAREHRAAWGPALYAQDAEVPAPQERPVTLKAVPYYAWANREPGGMAVWICSR
jgi:DUF1680 family protein